MLVLESRLLVLENRLLVLESMLWMGQQQWRPRRSSQVRPWWAWASSLHQQRRTHLHHSPL